MEKMNRIDKQEIEDALKGIGLSKNETKSFLTLVSFGQITAWKIAEITKLHRANVYEALRSLEKRGLVLCTLKEKTKYFEASDPKLLINFLKEKEIMLQKVVPYLASLRASKDEEKAYISEGISGIKATTDDILASLKKNDFVLTFGVPKDVSERTRSFIEIYHQRRIKKKILQKHLYNENAKERIAYLNSLPLTEARYLPSKFNSPVTTTIYKNKVVFWLWSENPLVITIESKRMADSYQKYFEFLWNAAKKS